MRRPLRGLLIVGLGLSVVLAGCATPEEPEVKLTDYVGKSIAQLEGGLPLDTGLVVYDISFPIVGKESRYRSAESGPEEDWMVVAACGSSHSVAAAVLNIEDYTKETAKAARAGEFNYLLVECAPPE